MDPSELLSLYRYAMDDVTHFALAMEWLCGVLFFFEIRCRPTQIDTRSISPIAVQLLKSRCHNIPTKYRVYCRRIFNSTRESPTIQRDALRRERRDYRGNAISSELVRQKSLRNNELRKHNSTCPMWSFIIALPDTMALREKDSGSQPREKKERGLCMRCRYTLCTVTYTYVTIIKM